MQTIRWHDRGSEKQIWAAVQKGESFTVVTEGDVALALSRTLGSEPMNITASQVKLVLAVVALLALAGLVLFAISRGYEIKGKVKGPNGIQYEISFSPKA